MNNTYFLSFEESDRREWYTPKRREWHTHIKRRECHTHIKRPTSSELFIREIDVMEPQRSVVECRLTENANDLLTEKAKDRSFAGRGSRKSGSVDVDLIPKCPPEQGNCERC